MADAQSLPSVSPRPREKTRPTARAPRRGCPRSCDTGRMRTAVVVGAAIDSRRRPDGSSHRLEAGAAGARRQRMAGPHRLRPLLEIAVEGGVESMDLGDRWGERKGLVLAPGVLPVEQAQHRNRAACRVGCDMLPGSRGDGQQRNAGRPAQALAGAGDEDVGIAIIGMDVHAGEGRHRIDQQQRAMLAHHAPDLADRIERARRACRDAPR